MDDASYYAGFLMFGSDEIRVDLRVDQRGFRVLVAGDPLGHEQVLLRRFVQAEAPEAMEGDPVGEVHVLGTGA